MAKNIHPIEFQSVVVCMTCNHQFNVSSSKQTTDKFMHVTYCCFCHSFYTGQLQFSATGRVSRFQRREKITETLKQKNIKQEKSQVTKKNDE